MPTKILKDDLDKLLNAVQSLTRTRVLVGIPGDAPPRKGAKQPPNFVLGLINEFGEPRLNIPARPFLIPGVADARDRIISAARSGARGMMNLSAGTPGVDKAEAVMMRMGEIAASSVRARLVSGPFQPLADSTVAARARRGRKGAIQEMKNRRAGLPDSTDLAKPLIDTGAMRQSVTYVLDKK